MPLYMDRHDFAGVTAVDVAGAHLKDLEVQDQFGVRLDGLMVASRSVVGPLQAAVQIQRRLAEASTVDGISMRVRIGISAGEPVTESNDLYGAAVQLAARLCSRAEPGTILVSSAVHDLALGKGFPFRKRSRLRLKGFDEAVSAFEVTWQATASADAADPGPM